MLKGLRTYGAASLNEWKVKKNYIFHFSIIRFLITSNRLKPISKQKHESQTLILQLAKRKKKDKVKTKEISIHFQTNSRRGKSYPNVTR